MTLPQPLGQTADLARQTQAAGLSGLLFTEAGRTAYLAAPNYAFIWDEAGFAGTTARIREKQKAGDFAGMATQITNDHLAVFATESTWDELANQLIAEYRGVATRLVLYNVLGDRERFQRYGEIARRISSGQVIGCASAAGDLE